MYSMPNYVEASENKSTVKMLAIVGSQIMVMSSLAFGGGNAPYNLLENGMPQRYERPANGNDDVHISFDSYEGIIFSMKTYNNSKNAGIGVAHMYIGEDLRDNLDQLNMIEQFEDDWNGEGASAFSKDLVMKVRDIILNLKLQPEVFPTARDSIQFEYYIDGRYLEFEVSEQGKCKVFSADESGNTHTDFVNADAEEVNKVVDQFYGTK